MLLKNRIGNVQNELIQLFEFCTLPRRLLSEILLSFLINNISLKSRIGNVQNELLFEFCTLCPSQVGAKLELT